MKVLLVPCTYSDQSAPPFWMKQCQELADRTRAWYLLESYGKVVMDLTIAPVQSIPYPSVPSRGMPPDYPMVGYTRIIYLTSGGYIAKGLNWGVSSWVACMGSDYSFFAAIHELGHSFGLPHPIALTIGAWDSAARRLTLPPLDVHVGGTTTAFYDGSTSMGYAATFASFCGPEEVQLGWISADLYSGGDKTFVLTALGVPGGEHYVVRIPMAPWTPTSPRVYWIEYRIDCPSGPANGVQLRVSGDFGCYYAAHVNLAYQPGESITDGTITLDVLSMTATTATIRLRDTPVIIQPVGNTQMLIDEIKAAGNALVLGQITQAQIDTGKAKWALLVADAIPAPGSASATFVSTDLTTLGNWKGKYGSDGHAVLGDAISYPSYATVTASGKADYTWTNAPTEARALQRAIDGRIAGCWFGNNFDVNINLTDSNQHQVALYLLDWDSTTRMTRIDVLDAATQQVIATQTMQAYRPGIYMIWKVQGHVAFRFTKIGGANAVVSGLFFDGLL